MPTAISKWSRFEYPDIRTLKSYHNRPEKPTCPLFLLDQIEVASDGRRLRTIVEAVPDEELMLPLDAAGKLPE